MSGPATWAALDGIPEEEIADSDEAMAILQEHAYRYLVAGGHWDPDTWTALSTAERGACVAAALRLRRESASLEIGEDEARERSLAESMTAAMAGAKR